VPLADLAEAVRQVVTVAAAASSVAGLTPVTVRVEQQVLVAALELAQLTPLAALQRCGWDCLVDLALVAASVVAAAAAAAVNLLVLLAVPEVLVAAAAVLVAGLLVSAMLAVAPSGSMPTIPQ